MRLFYLEPFLIRAESHFIETTLAVDSYLATTGDVDYHIVGNRSMTEAVRLLFPHAIPAITQTCFEKLDDHGESFLTDLRELNLRFSFKPTDVILIPTAYENQILGVGQFMREFKEQSPRFLLNFHQLFPPAKDSDIVGDVGFRRHWMKRLRVAFASAKSDRLSYWTTNTARLNSDYRRLSNSYVGVLPVPFLYESDIPTSSNQSDALTVAFVGEGRQEKGLLIFLRAIALLQQAEPKLRYTIQVNNPRGYSASQDAERLALLESFANNPSVHIIEGSLPPKEHHKLIRSQSILALPYNPINYHRRVSGVLMQAALYERPVVASEGTWSAQEIDKGHVSGLEFAYDKMNPRNNEHNLALAIQELVAKYSFYLDTARARSEYFKNECSPARYIQKVLNDRK